VVFCVCLNNYAWIFSSRRLNDYFEGHLFGINSTKFSTEIYSETHASRYFTDFFFQSFFIFISFSLISQKKEKKASPVGSKYETHRETLLNINEDEYCLVPTYVIINRRYIFLCYVM
jgi:hypothetical protein